MSSTDIINVKVILSNLGNDINEFELDFDFLELSYAIRARVRLLKLKQSFVLMKRCILRCLLNESENINLRGAFWLIGCIRNCSYNCSYFLFKHRTRVKWGINQCQIWQFCSPKLLGNDQFLSACFHYLFSLFSKELIKDDFSLKTLL